LTINNEKDYFQALAKIEVLMDSLPGSLEEKELDQLTNLVEKYEEQHFEITLPGKTF